MAEIKIFKNKKFNLKPKQIKALELLINCNLRRNEIAKEINVSERTLYNWMHHDEEFRKAWEWYRKEVYKDYAPEAVKTILDILRKGTSEKTRLAAAKDILDRAGDNAVSKVDLETENAININVRRMDEADVDG